jgi:lipopolysaccharide exporter
MLGATTSIAHRTVTGAKWLILWRIATRVLGFVSTLFLAKMLLPTDFGLLAVATTYVGAFDALSVFGFQDVIIRSENPSRALLDTAFTMTAVRGLLNGLLVAGTASVSSAFFGDPRLTPLLLILAGLLVLEGTENVGIVEFRRQFRFDKEFQLFIVPRLLSVVITIAAVFILKSYWGLLIGIGVSRVAKWALSYLLHSYRPRLCLSAWRQLLGFSLWTWGACIGHFVRDRSSTLILSRLFDPFQVGMFMMGSEIGQLPISEFLAPVVRALLPGFAAKRNAGDELGEAFVQAVSVATLLILPAAIGISAVAGYVIDIMLGPNWAAAIIVVQIIAITSPLLALSQIGGTAMVACGYVWQNFVITLTASCFAVAACLLLASRYGLGGAAASCGIIMAAEGLAYLIAAGRRLHAGFGALAARIWRPSAATAVMSLVLWTTGYGWATAFGPVHPSMIDCLCAMAIGASTYCAALGLLWAAGGRPAGPEAFVWGLIGRSLQPSKSRWEPVWIRIRRLTRCYGETHSTIMRSPQLTKQVRIDERKFGTSRL